jgi:hypothetical protein
MENKEIQASVPPPEDASKAKGQVIDPWNVQGEVAEDGSIKPIGMSCC